MARNEKAQSIEEVKKEAERLTKLRFEETNQSIDEQHKLDGNNQPVKK